MYQDRQQTQYAQQPAAKAQPQQNYTLQHDFESAASLTATVAHALSDVSGYDVSEIEAALDESVDLHALDRLFASSRGRPQNPNDCLTVTVHGYQVTLFTTGFITITPVQSRSRQH